MSFGFTEERELFRRSIRDVLAGPAPVGRFSLERPKQDGTRVGDGAGHRERVARPHGP